jgi:hypothetical protein
MSMPTPVIFAVPVPRLKTIAHSVRLVRHPAERKNHFESNLEGEVGQAKSLIRDVRVKIDAEVNSRPRDTLRFWKFELQKFRIKESSETRSQVFFNLYFP